jgi:hypothetical protein
LIVRTANVLSVRQRPTVPEAAGEPSPGAAHSISNASHYSRQDAPPQVQGEFAVLAVGLPSSGGRSSRRRSGDGDCASGPPARAGLRARHGWRVTGLEGRASQIVQGVDARAGRPARGPSREPERHATANSGPAPQAASLTLPGRRRTARGALSPPAGSRASHEKRVACGSRHADRDSNAGVRIGPNHHLHS